MAQKGYTPEQIINKLREAGILLSQGETVAIISKKLGALPMFVYYWLAQACYQTFLGFVQPCCVQQKVIR
jgi:predicted transcriptional regulator YheO